MEMKQLDFTETFKDAITIGMKNAPSVIAAVALFLVTIWIPYINIGTFIAILGLLFLAVFLFLLLTGGTMLLAL